MTYIAVLFRRSARHWFRLGLGRGEAGGEDRNVRSIWNRSHGIRKQIGKHPLDREIFLSKNQEPRTGAFTIYDGMVISRRTVQKRGFFGIPRSKEGARICAPTSTTGVTAFTAAPKHDPRRPFRRLWKGNSGTRTDRNLPPISRPVKLNPALCARLVIHSVVRPQSRAGVTTPFELYYLVFTPRPNYTPIRQLSGFAHWPPGSLSYCSCRY